MDLALSRDVNRQGQTNRTIPFINVLGVNKVRRHCSITYNFRINIHSILKLYRLITLSNTKLRTILQHLQKNRKSNDQELEQSKAKPHS